MRHRNVIVGDRSFVISPDDPVILGDRFWAVMRARILDELTGRPARGDMSIETDYEGLTTRVSSDGLVGLVGRPRQIFPALNPLDPNARTYDVNFTVHATGYLPWLDHVTIQTIPDFPNAFAPTFVDIQLHREPIVIRGRTVVTAGNTTNPLAGMTLSITGIWPVLPPGNVAPPPPDPPNLVSLSTPLYLPRTVATGALRQREMLPVAGQDKRLLENAASGETVLRLSDSVNLNPADVIAMDPLDPDRVEFLTIQAVAPSTTPTSVSLITLTHSLSREHRRDALVQRALPQAPGFSNLFNRDAQAGDVCVFLNSMTNLAVANVVEVSGAIGDPVEYHTIHRFTTTSDADGYFRLPLLSRVAQLQIQADDGGVHPTQVRTLIPNYEEHENRVDFIF